MNPEPPRTLVDVKEMARILTVPTSWLYERTRRGTIPCLRCGKYIRFDPDEVLAFLRRGERLGGKSQSESVS